MAYVFMSASNAGSSVQDKVLNQIKALNAIGRDCKGLFFSTDELHNLPAYILPIKVNKTNAKWFVKTKQRHAYFKALWMSLDLLNKYDIVYVRYPGANRLLLKTLKALHSKLIFIEHITAELPELEMAQRFKVNSLSSLFRKLEFYYFPRLQEKQFGKKIRQAVQFGICNSNDIINYQKTIFSDYQLYTVGDGIDAESMPIRVAPKLEKVFKMVFLKGANSNAEYNGLDRLMKGMKEYVGDYDLELHIYGRHLGYERQLAEQIGIQSQVFCWPYQTKASLDQLMNEFHVGVGQLALDLKKLNNNSTIKNRDYCARGIPFFYGHKDEDFNNVNFAYEIFTISISDIIQWYSSIILSNELEKNMHNFSLIKLDYKVKMNKVKNILNEYYKR